jgi:hypothetical protein
MFLLYTNHSSSQKTYIFTHCLSPALNMSFKNFPLVCMPILIFYIEMLVRNIFYKTFSVIFLWHIAPESIASEHPLLKYNIFLTLTHLHVLSLSLSHTHTYRTTHTHALHHTHRARTHTHAAPHAHTHTHTHMHPLTHSHALSPSLSNHLLSIICSKTKCTSPAPATERCRLASHFPIFGTVPKTSLYICTWR